ncbi:MobH family relaxase [Azomonas macrocytogenes]|uniref:Conjugal transfer pilus assembly protein TraI n=1 Tax=Azomonas macrocytogenes TaxID=69962 RepID=A0A839TAS5_AZOMA|nr:MobH family relaxase [Azomonas macrocytogenes]MBB3105244.1 conjugal transfer pilus assembly protein TraI [Azomonas macrocytogenes]
MLSFLKKFLNGAGPAPVACPPAFDDDIPRYPPFAKGLPVAPVDKLLATQSPLIERIRGATGYPNADFDRLVLPVLQRYAAFVHLLPASEAHHHRGAGGLLRHGLEVAFWTAQASRAIIFATGHSPREQRDNEPRWRFAALLTGLLHDVGKPLSDVAVTTLDGHSTWNPHIESLVEWANTQGADRYYLRWRDQRHKRHEQFSLIMVQHLMTREAWAYLNDPGPEISQAMMEAIGGVGMTKPLARLMLRADTESVARDMRQNRMSMDEHTYGVPVERYLFDAIRTLINTGVWKVNVPGAKVWHLDQGSFIALKQGATELYEAVQRSGVPGIPRDPDTLAEILIERGYAIPKPIEGKDEGAYYRYWEVQPAPLKEGPLAGDITLMLLRLESPELIFTSEPPAPVHGVIVNESGERDEPDKPEAGKEDAIPPSKLASTSAAPPPATPKPAAPTPKPVDLAWVDEPDTRKQKDKNRPLDFNDMLAELKRTSAPVPELNPVPGSAVTQVEAEIESDMRVPSPASPILPGQDQDVEQTSAEPEATQAQSVLSEHIDDLPAPPAYFTESLDYDLSEERAGQPTEAEPLCSDGTISEWESDALPSNRAVATNNPPNEIQPRAARQRLSEWLQHYPDAAAILEGIIDPILAGEVALGTELLRVQNKLVIPYPTGTKRFGKPTEVMGTLFAAGAIVADPVLTSRKVHDFDGVKALVLDAPLATVLDEALNEAAEALDPMAVPVPKTEAPITSATEEELLARNKRKKIAPTEPLEKAAPAIQEQPVTVAPQQSELMFLAETPIDKPSTDVTSTAASTQSPVRRRERPPQPESHDARPDPVAEESPSAHDDTPEQMGEPDPETDATQWIVQEKKVEQKPREIEALRPATLTTERAIAELKNQILCGEGRWLASEVIEQDGYRVTSALALDLIAAYAPENLGKTALRMELTLNSKRPRLYLKQQKLWLKVN